MSEQTVVSHDTIRRLARDVREIMKNPLDDNGIHYVHSDTDMLHGQVMIEGPQGTPYAHGHYYFDIRYPANYPQSPPVFTYDTNDGRTRFNPNLYKNGKVCISVLNTWRGDQWSPCQTISSILLSVCSVLNDKPLLNEPGFKETDIDFHKYTQTIEYKNYSIGIVKMLESEYIKDKYPGLYETSTTVFLKNYKSIMENLDKSIMENLEKHKNNEPHIITTRVYGMETKVDYKKTREDIERVYKELKN